jgi:uncharacterized protein YqjF (DUF2071 family)
VGVTDLFDLLASPFMQGRVTRVTDHRPWPMPERPFVMGQTWMDLLFAHWSVPPDALERAVPPQLPLDTFEDRAWIGVTPFAVRNLRLRLTFPVPFLSAFPEINVRTYVTVGGKPGIFFFSLDADSGPAVATARRAYRLPYFRARMAMRRAGEEVDFSTTRTDDGARAPADFRGRYRAVGDAREARPGSLEHFLTERYCLYTLDDQERVRRAEIHHPPWPLQDAEAAIETNTMGAEVDLAFDGEPVLHFSRRQDVVFWPLEVA